MGVGSPIVDALARVPDTFLVEHVAGAKGGMELVDRGAMEAMLASLEAAPSSAPGGSAANTTFALARLGQPAAFIGKLADDELGKFYRARFAELGGDTSRFKISGNGATAQCLSLITPDSERTMRTDLAVAATLAPEEITVADFEDAGHVHVEGYLLFNRALAGAVLEKAKRAGCTISLDLGSMEVVAASRAELDALLRDYVDMVFANEDEASAFLGEAAPERALAALADLCELAVVKLGADGALLQHRGQHHRAEALRVDNVIDTTGAGDFWAAGFLYGFLRTGKLDAAARLGALLGAEVVQQVGADLDDAGWERVERQSAQSVTA